MTAGPAPRRNLTGHAARVLDGTGLSPAAAAALAAGGDAERVTPGTEPVVRALRDGWDAAGTVPAPGTGLDEGLEAEGPG